MNIITERYNWRIVHDPDRGPSAEIKIGSVWVWPDCTFQCAHCLECLGCIRKLVGLNPPAIPEDVFRCPKSPNGLHLVIRESDAGVEAN